MWCFFFPCPQVIREREETRVLKATAYLVTLEIRGHRVNIFYIVHQLFQALTSYSSLACHLVYLQTTVDAYVLEYGWNILSDHHILALLQ